MPTPPECCWVSGTCAGEGAWANSVWTGLNSCRLARRLRAPITEFDDQSTARPRADCALGTGARCSRRWPHRHPRTAARGGTRGSFARYIDHLLQRTRIGLHLVSILPASHLPAHGASRMRPVVRRAGGQSPQVSRARDRPRAVSALDRRSRPGRRQGSNAGANPALAAVCRAWHGTP